MGGLIRYFLLRNPPSLRKRSELHLGPRLRNLDLAAIVKRVAP